MVAEVADRTVTNDRQMVRVYGPAGIPVYWFINLKARRVEVYTGPGPGGYAAREDFEIGRDVPVIIGGVKVGQIAVSDILPPGPPASGNGA